MFFFSKIYYILQKHKLAVFLHFLGFWKIGLEIWGIKEFASFF